MGFDTRFWGPSAWQLFHLTAVRSESPQEVLALMKDILPCKFCRQSTAQYVRETPLGTREPGRWLYDLHNKVNAKLREQATTDPAVVGPGEDPSFEEVQSRYKTMKPVQVPGRDFLFSIAANYPDHPEEADRTLQRSFLQALTTAYPFPLLRSVVARFVAANEPALQSRQSYMKWMYGLLTELSGAIGLSLPTYRGYAHRVAYYRSGCSKKTYHGKTCRTMAGGGRTKDRDRRKTYRVSHAPLL